MKRFDVKVLVAVSLLTAVQVILSRFCSINAWNLKVGFSFLPVAIAAYLYGPAAAGAVGGLGDFIGALLFPIGPYFPGFTLTCFLSGVVFGLLLRRRPAALCCLLAVAFNQLALGLGLNTLWISLLYGADYGALLLTRMVQCAILIPIEYLTVTAMMKTLTRFRREAFA